MPGCKAITQPAYRQAGTQQRRDAFGKTRCGGKVSGIAFPYVEGFCLLLEYFTTLYNIMKFIIAINNIGILL